MADAFDRASTLNFTTLARVEGAIADDALVSALRALEARHPLLTARIDRSGARPWFRVGEAAPIPLIRYEGDTARVRRLAEESLAHRTWADDGERASLAIVRHGPEDATLLLTLHHVVSDGSSGIFAMRDLLEALGGSASRGAPVASPGQHAFFPRGRGGAIDLARAVEAVVATGRRARPYRFKPERSAPPEERRPQLATIALDRAESEALAARAREARATVHGVLVAALARAVVDDSGTDRPIRVLHPIDFRRYLAGLEPSRPRIDDAIGYYVSSVDTDSSVGAHATTDALAATISAAVRDAKGKGAPFTTGPSAGRFVTLLDRMLSPAEFVRVAERSLFTQTFSFTNLGRLEALDVGTRYGALRLRDLSFVAASSVIGALSASATSFDGRITMHVGHHQPAIAGERAARLVERTHETLSRFAAGG